MDNKQANIIDLIKKCLALAGSPNENEAARAMEKAQELLAKYNVTMDQVKGTPDAQVMGASIINRDYDIATINETVAGMVSSEIGAIIYRIYVPQEPAASQVSQSSGPVFDFNKAMREIRLAVDDFLARGD